MDQDNNLSDDEDFIPDEFWEALAKLRQSAKDEEAFGLQGCIAGLPDYGTFHLSLREAAALITLDRQRAGECPDFRPPQPKNGEHPTITLLYALLPESEKMIEALCADIAAGRLAAPTIRRSIDGQIIPELTFVGVVEIQDWLRQRCYVTGDTFDEYWRVAGERREQLLRHAMYLRLRRIPDPPFPGILDIELEPENIDDLSKEELVEHFKALEIKNRQLSQALHALHAPQHQQKQAPGREHVSDKLAILNQAAFQHWGTVIKDDRASHPNNDQVAAWLVERGFSQTLADQGATMIRPSWAATGRKPEK